ncbi:D-tyrosyl-tRNA(Tyr) deacylase [Marinobacter daepoensis]|uniref:D-aminoacyl-tRNA deacylase n=1 Tax=Marinobacter daepoensis TaxID=262077 RepID=A0ABS3BG63_9GAMM|nr:D-aminoacyl-tRNA deacylase [Marinobacter daepoensis]MBN7770591.1 D-tyrosyl-tRNA(Tyr) deacylase [Marinobacter daepoensis]MBY6034638.1 D-tyrosyl-tRNA(Tyr) deacylase [Marinobacter daepoensis]MBY6080533.1 D-tyrosyl-tRNA(Tyr) deacylase [Marinobacter daepoensis]
MKGLIQRVSEASVAVSGETVGRIGPGLLLLLGVEKGDALNEAKDLCRKILSYRVFPDEQGRMNVSVLDSGGSLLVVPQFTLAADTSSGTRPGFSLAAAPGPANQLYREFVVLARQALGDARVGTGEFGADMKVALVNDGPVTFMLETGRKEACTKM